ncbi:hypothetical protein BJ165DRAFT_1501932 [Panaeolus papilionaceus]|nr:hypothetical protein BJ165DRAFT_1501932 [Panaeolus papilionaceus]
MSQGNNGQYMIKDASCRPVAEGSIDYVEDRRDLVTLLVGPTGAGKSRFIEALSRSEALGISKDQLDSVTHKITTYEMIDDEYWQGPGTPVTKFPIQPSDPRFYLLDTPGFSDHQISEVEIMTMLRDWMTANQCGRLHYILYFWPITDTRVSGSKRRTIKMLKLLARVTSQQPGELSVVTTMWNRLWSDRTKVAAEERFEQLRDDVWGDLTDRDECVIRFMNTHESAVDIIGQCWRRELGGTRYAAIFSYDTQRFGDSLFGQQLFQDLIDRITNLQLQQQALENDLQQTETQKNEELVTCLEEQLRTTKGLLTKFENQLIDFGNAPAGFEDAMHALTHTILEKRTRQAEMARLNAHAQAIHDQVVASTSADNTPDLHPTGAEGNAVTGKSKVSRFRHFVGGMQMVKKKLRK